MADFLLEIGCEEIPARMIDAASTELAERVAKLLERERLIAAWDAFVSAHPDGTFFHRAAWSAHRQGCSSPV